MKIVDHKVVENIAVKKVNLTRATKEHAEEFKKLLFRNSNNGYNNVIIDLSRCEFIDSTFISALISALKDQNKNGYTLKLVTKHPDVQSIIELTGLVKVFETYKSVKEAISSYNK
jgi:anti-anti-sigma factor